MNVWDKITIIFLMGLAGMMFWLGINYISSYYKNILKDNTWEPDNSWHIKCYRYVLENGTILDELPRKLWSNNYTVTRCLENV